MSEKNKKQDDSTAIEKHLNSKLFQKFLQKEGTKLTESAMVPPLVRDKAEPNKAVGKQPDLRALKKTPEPEQRKSELKSNEDGNLELKRSQMKQQADDSFEPKTLQVRLKDETHSGLKRAQPKAQEDAYYEPKKLNTQEGFYTDPKVSKPQVEDYYEPLRPQEDAYYESERPNFKEEYLAGPKKPKMATKDQRPSESPVRFEEALYAPQQIYNPGPQPAPRRKNPQKPALEDPSLRTKWQDAEPYANFKDDSHDFPRDSELKGYSDYIPPGESFVYYESIPEMPVQKPKSPPFKPYYAQEPQLSLAAPEFNDFKSLLHDKEEEVRILKQDLENARLDLSDLEEKLASVGDLERRLKNLRVERDMLDRKARGLEEENEEIKRQMQNLREDLDNARLRAEDVERMSKGRSAEMERELRGCKERISDLERELAREKLKNKKNERGYDEEYGQRDGGREKYNYYEEEPRKGRKNDLYEEEPRKGRKNEKDFYEEETWKGRKNEKDFYEEETWKGRKNEADFYEEEPRKGRKAERALYEEEPRKGRKNEKEFHEEESRKGRKNEDYYGERKGEHFPEKGGYQDRQYFDRGDKGFSDRGYQDRGFQENHEWKPDKISEQVKARIGAANSSSVSSVLNWGEKPKKNEEVLSIENKILSLQIDKKRLEEELTKLPEHAKKIAIIRRREEVEYELANVHSTIASLKIKVKQIQGSN